MSYQKGLLNVLKVLSWVQPPGMTPAHLAERLELSTRSVYRYLLTLEEAGFDLVRVEGRYQLNGQDDHQFMSQVTASEVGLLIELVSSLPEQHPQRYALLSKLGRGAEGQVEEGAWLVTAASEARNISRLQEAMQEQRQVVLKKYHSLHRGELRDRRVEPIALSASHSYLHGFDLEDGRTKLFKISRIAEISILQLPATHRAEYEIYEPDLFGIAGPEVHETEVQLSVRAKSLLVEEFPAAEEWIQTDPEHQAPVFRGPVKGWEGIGRFLLGLPGEWRIVRPQTFRQYMNKQVARYPRTDEK